MISKITATNWTHFRIQYVNIALIQILIKIALIEVRLLRNLTKIVLFQVCIALIEVFLYIFFYFWLGSCYFVYVCVPTRDCGGCLLGSAAESIWGEVGQQLSKALVTTYFHFSDCLHDYICTIYSIYDYDVAPYENGHQLLW